MGGKSPERGQKRGVDIEHLAFPARHEPGCQSPHETGEANELHLMRLEFAVELTLESFAIAAERAVIDDFGRDARRLGAREARRVGEIRDHEHDIRRIVLGSRGFQEGRHVAAAPGNEDRGSSTSLGRARHNASRPR